MASRVGGFRRRTPSPVREEEEVVGPMALNVRAEVTSDVIDAAVDETLRDLPEDSRENMRTLWALDNSHEMARAYFADQVRKRTAGSFSAITKRKVVLREVLTQDEVVAINNYAPEYDVLCINTDSHDHGFFSARRKIDHIKLMSRFPAGKKFLDVGGSVQYHVNSEHEDCIVVAPYDVDFKDPQRLQLTKLALRGIALDKQRSETARRMANDVLNGGETYMVNKTAQTVTTRASLSMSCHVYDVPIQDWARMMERCGILVHEGCVHWSNDFFEKKSGILAYSSAYYEIDHEADVFRMRVGQSASAWYEHKWSDYMRYGANQVIVAGDYKYSYQIVERKPDTIFFRILRVGATASPDFDQVYTLPNVPMVEVEGFDVRPPRSNKRSKLRDSLVRRKYVWPAELWNRMVLYAGDEVVRGGLSYDKLYNYYRTAVPEHSINSVHIVGGQQVPLDEIPALVVASAAVAHTNMFESTRSLKYQTAEIQRERRMRDEPTWLKFVLIFWEGMVEGEHCLFSPFAAKIMQKWYTSLMSDLLISWKPKVKFMPINAALLVDHTKFAYKIVSPNQIDYREVIAGDRMGALMDEVQTNSAMASVLLKSCGDKLPPEFRAKLTDTVGETATAPSVVSGTTVVETSGTTLLSKAGKTIKRTVLSKDLMEIQVRDRRLAVQEAIDECNAEYDAVEASCFNIFQQIVRGTRIDVNFLMRQKEQLFNPDIWSVKGGVLIKSEIYDESKFTHAAVYCPQADAKGAHVLPVYEEIRSGTDGDRSYMKMPFDYYGYVLVIDALRIYNGPDIAATMEQVLQFPDEAFEFTVTCHQGPPGCGKTTTVTRDGDPNRDVYMAPTRLAVAGLRDKLVEVHKVARKRVNTVVRTFDSFLVNYDKLPAEAKSGFRSLLVDEYVLTRAGKIVTAIVLLGMRDVHVYGDDKQLSHKCRVQAKQSYVLLNYQVLEQEYLTYRCAPRILAMFNYMYDHTIRSTRSEVGEVKTVKRLDDVKFMNDVRVLTFYQADKMLIRQMLSTYLNRDVRINTVHEAQGTDCDQVVLFNPNMRAVPIDQPGRHLPNEPEYCLVGASRARLSFIYLKPSGADDLVMRMIARAQDPRRVSACADVKSQGQSIEFL